MTVQSQTSRADYDGNGATTLFVVPFYFLLDTDLQVLLTDTAPAATAFSTLVLGSGYTVAGAGNPAGGSITLAVAPTNAQQLSILRNVPYTQLKHYVPNDPFPAASHEMGLDKLTMEVQQLAEQASRALTLPPNTDPGEVSSVLPPPESLKLIGWNEDADALQNVDPATMATIVAFGTANSDLFSGTGAQTAFALTANPGSRANLDVAISGVTQRPGIDYDWNGGTTLTFAVAPPAGANNILARYMQGLPQGHTTADLVGYQPRGLNATPSTVYDTLMEVAPISSSNFGADPTGVTNSTDAMIAMSAAVQAQGGGYAKVQPGTYTLGRQLFAGATGKGYAYQASPLFKLTGCAKPVVLDLTGCTFRFASGLKFGAFDPTTGLSTGGTTPNTNNDERADVGIMFLFEGCTGGGVIIGGNFDGNMDNITLGGVWGDAGRQNFGTAIYIGNGFDGGPTYSGPIRILDTVIKDMPLDGIYFATDENPALLENIKIDKCGRNNITWAGGKSLTMRNVHSTNAGQGVISSSPASCFDIESEVTGYDYNLLAENCKFINGFGSAIVALPAAQGQFTFESCVIAGDLQINNFFTRLNNCLAVATVNFPPFAAPNWTRGITATNTTFTTNGAGYGVTHTLPVGSPLFSVSGFNRSVVLHNCFLEVLDGCYLGLFDTNTIFHDCYISQSGSVAVPQTVFAGTFHGQNKGYVGRGEWSFGGNVSTSCLVYDELSISFDAPGTVTNWGYNGASPGVSNYAPHITPNSQYRSLTVNDPTAAVLTIQTSSITTGAKLALNDGNFNAYISSLPAASTTNLSIGVAGGERLRIGPTGIITPGADNTQPLGYPATRFSVVYAGTGTINTSDAREKQQARDLTEVERAVAVRCRDLLRAFKFNDAVAAKGDEARWHFGVMAQDVRAAFQAEGLVAEDYALFCYDEWEAQPEIIGPVLDEYGHDTGETMVMAAAIAAGNRYGIRYEELLAFILSAM